LKYGDWKTDDLTDLSVFTSTPSLEAQAQKQKLGRGLIFRKERYKL